MKRTVLDKLKRAEETLEETNARLAEKRDEARQLAEEPAPKGDDLKRYVAHLRARSALYKQRRAELAGLRAEGGVLNRTLHILESKVSYFYFINRRRIKILIAKQLSNAKSNIIITPTRSAKGLPDGLTTDNAIAANAELMQTISGFRAQLVPLLNGISLSNCWVFLPEFFQR